MEDPYITGSTQPDTKIFVSKGKAIGGHAIGILVLDLWYPLIPGKMLSIPRFKNKTLKLERTNFL